jgi:FtsH-binding integral membrane protein
MNVIQSKAPFMSAVFANLIFQGLVTYQSAKTVIDSPSYSDYMARNTLFNLLLLLGLFLVLVFAKLSLPFKFGLFTMISILMGAYLSPQANIKEALLEVVTIFIGMFILGLLSVQFGFDLRPLGILLFFGLLALILARLFSPGEKKYAKIGSLLFALFVVFDTNNILKKNYGGDFIDASLDYFLDIFNLLQYRMDN